MCRKHLTLSRKMNILKQICAYKLPSQKLKANGKGTAEHHPIVSEEDRIIYTNQSTLVQILRLAYIAKYNVIFPCSVSQ